MNYNDNRPQGANYPEPQAEGESERLFLCEDVVVIDSKRQRVDLINPSKSIIDVVESMREGGGKATAWRRLLLGGILGLPEPRELAAADELLEAVFDVASRPEFQRAERRIPPAVVHALTVARTRQGVPPDMIAEELDRMRRPYRRVQAARFRTEVLHQVLLNRYRREREGRIRRTGRIAAERIRPQARSPEDILEDGRREERKQRLLAELYETAPPTVQQIVLLMLEKNLSVSEACRQAGVDRVKFESWINSVQRHFGIRGVRKVKSLRARRPKAS